MAKGQAEEAVREPAEGRDGAPSGGLAAKVLATLADHIFLWERDIPHSGSGAVDRLSILPPLDLFDARPAEPEAVETCLEVLGGPDRVFLGRALAFAFGDRAALIAEVVFLCPDVVKDGGAEIRLVAQDGSEGVLLLTLASLPKARVIWRNADVTGIGVAEGCLIDLGGDPIGAAPGKAPLPQGRALDLAVYGCGTDNPLQIGPVTFIAADRTDVAATPFRTELATSPDDTFVELRVVRSDGKALDPDDTDMTALARHMVATVVQQFHLRRKLASDPRLRALASLSDQAQQPRDPVTFTPLLGLFPALLRALSPQDEPTPGQMPAAAVEPAIMAAGREGADLSKIVAAVQQALAPDGGQPKMALVSRPVLVATLDTIRIVPPAGGAEVVRMLGSSGFLAPKEGPGTTVETAAVRAALQAFGTRKQKYRTSTVWKDMPHTLRTQPWSRKGVQSDPQPPDSDPMQDRINTDFRGGKEDFNRSLRDPVLCNPISWLLEARQQQGMLPVTGRGTRAFDNLIGDLAGMSATVSLFSQGAPGFLLDLTDSDLAPLVDARPPRLTAILAQDIADEDVTRHFDPRQPGDAPALTRLLRDGITKAALDDLGVTGIKDFAVLLGQSKVFLDLLKADADDLPDPPRHDLGPPPGGLSLPPVSARTATGRRIIDQETWPDRLGQKADKAAISAGTATIGAEFLRALLPDRSPFNNRQTIDALNRLMIANRSGWQADPAQLTEIGNDLARVWATDASKPDDMRVFVAYLQGSFEPGRPLADRVKALLRAAAAA